MTNRVDPTWTHLRQREPPLYQMPHMWQPNLNMPNPYHSSHCDRVQNGWRKWGHDYPDMYARSAAATVPDWYSRKVSNVRSGDQKELYWSWEQPSKPTQKKTYGLQHEPQRSSVQRGYNGTPHDIHGQVVVPQWGLYHPNHYQEPSRVEHLPSLHSDMKHL